MLDYKYFREKIWSNSEFSDKFDKIINTLNRWE
jgi:hypothetical protein